MSKPLTKSKQVALRALLLATGDEFAEAVTMETGCRNETIMAYFMNQFIMTDAQKRRWHIMQREDGSVCLYYTTGSSPAHWVVFDDNDNRPPYEAAAKAELTEAGE